MTAAARSEPWYPPDPPPTERQARKQGLADQVRTLIADVLMLDASETSDADLAEAERLLAAACAQVASLPTVRGNGGLFGSADDVSFFERGPLSGRCNALSAPLVMSFEGELTRAHATYGDAYEGPPGCVHGGHVIAAFDDLLGVGHVASGSAGLTGTLSVRLVGMTPLHERIDYEAGYESVQGRKIFAWGRSYWQGRLLAEATGIFIVPSSGIPVTEPQPRPQPLR